jgi:thioredoxin-related protein
MSWARRVHISRNTEIGRGVARAGAIIALAFAALPMMADARTPDAALPAADDLARDGQVALSQGEPLVILFSLPGCSYCETVRRNYLLPISKDGKAVHGPMVREADMSSAVPLRGIDGEASSGKALAKQYGIRVAPSVLLIDGRGRRLAPVLEGGDMAGMYGAYLEDRLANARRALDEGR